jgi:glycerol-3-phosphate dehydrogenase
VGNGEDPNRIIAEEGTTVEGYRATEGFHAICQERGISCPILDGIHGILYGSRPPADIRKTLMGRELKEEAECYDG